MAAAASAVWLGRLRERAWLPPLPGWGLGDSEPALGPPLKDPRGPSEWTGLSPPPPYPRCVSVLRLEGHWAGELAAAALRPGRLHRSFLA